MGAEVCIFSGRLFGRLQEDQVTMMCLHHFLEASNIHTYIHLIQPPSIYMFL